MSLLNQMLNDLEQRRAETAGAPAMHRDIRPLPAAAGFPWGRLVGVVLVLVAGFGGAAWWWFAGQAERSLAAVPVGVSAPASAAVLPALIATAPAPAADLVVDQGSAPPPAVAVERELPKPQSEPSLSAADLRLSQRLSLSATAAPAVEPTASPAPAKPSLAPAAISTKPPPVDGEIDKRARDSDPREQAERLYRSAVQQLAQGREPDGMTTLRAALQDDPGHLAARQLLIKLQIDQRAYDAAQGELEEGLRRLPKQTAWAMLLARLRVDRGDAAAGLAVLERHEPFAASAADYQAAIAAMLQRLNRHAEAEARFVRASASEPANGRWWLGLAMAREAQGKLAEARDAYRSALATNLSADLRAFAEAKAK